MTEELINYSQVYMLVYWLIPQVLETHHNIYTKPLWWQRCGEKISSKRQSLSKQKCPSIPLQCNQNIIIMLHFHNSLSLSLSLNVFGKFTHITIWFLVGVEENVRISIVEVTVLVLGPVGHLHTERDTQNRKF